MGTGCGLGRALGYAEKSLTKRLGEWADKMAPKLRRGGRGLGPSLRHLEARSVASSLKTRVVVRAALEATQGTVSAALKQTVICLDGRFGVG